MSKAFVSLAAVALIAGAGQAALVQVEITGTVDFNGVQNGPFGAVNAGDAATVSFQLDSDLFLDSPNFPVRGYEILQPTFSVTLGSVVAGLQNPFPAGQTPYFVVRNNDPAVDGFYLSTNVDFPFAPPLDVPGALGQFGMAFETSYPQDTLSSLDILDAVGTYDLNGLSTYYFAVTDGPFEAMFIAYEQMTISLVPAPGALALLGLASLAPRRRRR